MNYEQLATHRTTLLDLYTSLHEALDKEGKRVDASLRATQKNIAAEKFLLAIVGEVKAGKSTFINALLGEAILPYDALQATSEIIEIDKSDKKEVRVAFANGTEQVVEDDLQTPENETVPFLKKIAAVKDEYRDIPIVQVNKFLMDHYDDEKGEAVFSEKELRDLLETRYRSLEDLPVSVLAIVTLTSPLPSLPWWLRYLKRKEIKKEKKRVIKSFPQELWTGIQSQFREDFQNYLMRLEKEIDEMIKEFCDEYNSTFDGELQERQQYMENLEKEQKAGEELRDEISTLEDQKKVIEDNIKMCIRIGGSLP